MSRYSILTPALFTLATLAAACGGEGSSASFAKATTAQREAAVHTATGFGITEALVAADVAELDSKGVAGGCPKRSVSGQTVTYEGGCVAASGLSYEGRLVAKNGPAVADDTQPSELRFEGFAIHDARNKLALDGSIQLSAYRSQTQRGWTSAITIDTGVEVRIDAQVSCALGDDHTRCATVEGARGEITGLGEFGIAYAYQSKAGAASGSLVLSGEDVLEIQLPVDSAGCYGYAIDGASAGKVCQAPAWASSPSSTPRRLAAPRE
jgi:hypothetical protein